MSNLTVVTIRDYFASLIRTLVPVAVGLVLARAGINAVDVEGIPLQTVVSGVCVGLYYAGVRLLEARWPRVGILLGWPASPSYLRYGTATEPQTLHH